MADPTVLPASRHAHIDVAKGIGIALVVLGHGWWLFDSRPRLLDVITSFHLPIFLFLSGVLLRPGRSWATFAAGRAQALLKPYFTVLLALAVAAVALRGQRFADRAAAMLYGNGETLTWIPMWFLPYTWLVMLAAYWLIQRRAVTGHAAVRTALLLALAWGGALAVPLAWDLPVSLFGQEIVVRGLPFSVDLVPIGCFFMLLGYALRVYVLADTGRWVRIACWAAPAVFLAWHALLPASLDLNLRRYDDPLLSTVAALVGIAGTLAAARALARAPGLGPMLGYLGKASLFILIFHQPVQAAAWQALHPSLGTPGAALLAWLAGLAVPTLFFAAAGRIAPLRALLLPAPRTAGPDAQRN